MLIVQPWLIRSRRRDIHRVIGRVSFVLAPLVVISALCVLGFYVLLCFEWFSALADWHLGFA
jgi:hypothetical protein